jgi:hypothetical protein
MTSRLLSAVFLGTLLNTGCGESETKQISHTPPDPNGPIKLFNGSRNQTEIPVSENQQSGDRSGGIRK